MIQESRIKRMSDSKSPMCDFKSLPIASGQYVIYWMQASMRIQYNHALAAAIHYANDNKLPLVVCFVLADAYPEANLRHYTFMLEGISEIHDTLQTMGIKFILLRGEPQSALKPLMNDNLAALFMDRGYTRIQRAWRQAVLDKTGQAPIYQIESDVVVPVEKASIKQEYAARTIRTKIRKLWDEFLVPLEIPCVIHNSLEIELSVVDHAHLTLSQWLDDLKIDISVLPSMRFKGGEREAQRLLKAFVEDKLPYYDLSNHPEFQYSSNLSGYLHFGQISPVDIALTVRQAKAGENGEAFLEELIVRRELSMNFVYYNPDGYDRFEGMTYPWAYETMAQHEGDPRAYIYERAEFEQSQTHDPYWNAANLEMVLTGKMHNYMRMYWCKKIVEWTRTYKEAYEIAIFLNNKYALDGRDPNSYTGIAWCFGQHDRAWAERPIFGKLRYMNAAGLERKFDMDQYVEGINVIKAMKDIKSINEG